MINTTKIRQDFPILNRIIDGKKLVYLDNAATSQKPKQVIEAVEEYYYKHNANVHRGIHQLSEEASEMYEESRRVVAEFIGAKADELVFVKNATEGINLVAFAWALNQVKEGDEILTTEMEHHANIVPWQQVAINKGAKLKVVGVTDQGELNMDDYERKLSKKTKLVAVTHVSNTTGVINPIEDIVRMARKVGAKTLVDSAQGAQHLGVDVEKLKCDFLVIAGHKMMAPMGISGLYINKEIQDQVGPFMTGGGMISEVYKDKSKWADGVEKWEAGTPNVGGAIGLAEAVRYHNKLGLKKIREHEKELTEYALKELKRIKGVKIVGPEGVEARGGVISFTVDGVHAHDVAEVLNSESIAVRSGHHCTMPLHNRLGLAATTRASFYVYNQKQEVDRLIEGLLKVNKVFGL
jgi:cysteine desulfurase / selenocysteine lyase